jgi:virginiamycin B lyase
MHHRAEARRLGHIALAGLTVAILVAAGPAAAAPHVEPQELFRIRSFPVPTNASNPIRIALGADGNLWFAESNSNQVARITPRGVVTEFPLPTESARPTDITAGPDGAMWFTEGPVGTIGRISSSGRIREFRFGDTNSAENITAGPDGNLWFTEPSAGKVWRFNLTARTFTDFSDPTPDSSPLDITDGPDGNLWFTETDRIGRITPAGAITEFGEGLGHAYGITDGPDGNVWFVERFEGRVGKITPDGEFTFYSAPKNTLEDIALGPDGNLWVTEFAYNMVARVTPDGVMTESQLVEGSSPSGISPGPRNTVWFLGFFADRVYRLIP